MATWYAPYAWLGGPDLERDVLIEVDDGMIDSVSTGVVTDGDHALDGIVIPGLVSAHSHAFHRALRGRTHQAGGDFWAWREPMYELAASLDPDSYRELAKAVFSEMVASGITCVGEFHYLHHKPDGRPYEDPNAIGLALIDAAHATGIRMTLIDTLYLTSDVDGTPVTPEQRRFSDKTAGQWAERVSLLADTVADDPLIRVGVAAHSIRGVAAGDLSIVAATADRLDTPLHIHVSEQTAENEAALSHHGLTPIGLLQREGFLSPRTTLVHGTHLTPEDIDMIAESGAGVCFCPTTESDLGDGIGPARELVDAGVQLSLGSDSNAVIDILHEGWRLEQHDRLRLRRRGVHSPESLVTMATTHGMHALGWPGGSLAPGAPADFVSIDPTSSDLAGTQLTLESMVSSATRASVRDVVIAGTSRKGA